MDNATSTGPALGAQLPYITNTECIYLDYNATTPIFPEVTAAMTPFLTYFGNPSSQHAYAQPCRNALHVARNQVAALVGARADEVFFTSCGTESDNWAIYGSKVAARERSKGRAACHPPHVVTSQIEHPAVMAYLEHLQQQGQLTYTAVPVNHDGLVDPNDVANAITPQTALVTIMHSNNEVGSLQPIQSIAEAARSRQTDGQRILVHTDAAQSLGKVKINVEQLGVDMLTIVGHKFGAPKGVAALYIRQGTELGNYLYGGGQEHGRRAGTENVLLAVGLGAAAAVVTAEAEELTKHMQAQRDSLQQGLLAAFPEGTIKVNGPADNAKRLPNTLSVSIKGFNSSLALQHLSSQLAASAGAACHSHDGPSISAVLKAMGVPAQLAVGTLRLSTGRHTTPDDIAKAVELIVQEAHTQGVL